MLKYKGRQYIAVPVPERYQEGVFYHGTDNAETAKKILQAGELKPGRIYDDPASMESRAGQVYFTPDLYYALAYTLGAHPSCEPGVLCKRGGRYGYLFVIPSGAVEDVLPDEDAVGRTLCAKNNYWLVDALRKLTKDHRREFEQILDRIQELQYEAYIEDQADAGEEIDTFENYDYSFFDSLKQCLYPEVSVAGKFFLKYADEELIEELLEEMEHSEALSHTGAVQFSEAWRFDKQRADKLAKDGSNFFELAEQVR